MSGNISELGLKRGIVKLYPHDAAWEAAAEDIIKRLREPDAMGEAACDIQHVGSTSIKSISAKPIIDIAVAVDSFEYIPPIIPRLANAAFIHREKNDNEWQRFFICEAAEDIVYCHIHVVLSGGERMRDYINFRDYMNSHIKEAKSYEALKLRLMSEYKNDRIAYTDGKAGYITRMLVRAQAWSYLGKTVTVKVDRAAGSRHPRCDSIVYPINYGYIPGVVGGDGDELDAYILGTDSPLDEYTGRVVGIIYRENDDEDKLVVAPDGMSINEEIIESAVYFQEQYYIHELEVINN